MPVQAQRGDRIITPTHLQRHCCGQHHTWAVLPLRKSPSTHFMGGWVGLGVQSGQAQQISPQPGFDPRTIQPVAGRCTSYTIPASHIYKF